MRTKLASITLALVVFGGVAITAYFQLTPPTLGLIERLASFDSPARVRLLPDLFKNEIDYPPRRAVLLAFNDRRAAELLAQGHDNKWHLIRRYTMTSGAPAGSYSIDRIAIDVGRSVALTLSADDSGGAAIAIRARGGADAMVMPQAAIEELATLSKALPGDDLRIVISATDWRQTGIDASVDEPSRTLARTLAQYVVPEPPQPLTQRTARRDRLHGNNASGMPLIAPPGLTGVSRAIVDSATPDAGAYPPTAQYPTLTLTYNTITVQGL